MLEVGSLSCSRSCYFHIRQDGDIEYLKKNVKPPTYEETLDALSSLITKRTRADKSNKGDQFDVLFDYVKILDLEDSIFQMKVIHVAGINMHIYRIDTAVEISEDKFLAYFWWCFERLKEKSSEDVPMPTYFRFLALLAFKIFAAEQVEVAILEVGLGGKFDATNLATPLERLLVRKLQKTPAFTVPQPSEAMGVALQVAHPLDSSLLNGLQLGLQGEHQYINAGLAVALCRTWLQKMGHYEGTYLDQANSLPEQFVKGLTTASLQGRAQIVADPFVNVEGPGDAVFYLDGAHSPESMEICGNWFSLAIKEDTQHYGSLKKQPYESSNVSNTALRGPNEFLSMNSIQILLFNCMSVRDPQLLLPRLIRACANQGVHFQKALFVPNQSVYSKVGSHALPSSDPQVDLSWQLQLEKVWKNLVHEEKDSTLEESKEDCEHSIRNSETSIVFPSLPLAIKWLMDSVQQNRSVRFQVLVTGSLHLVGDVLRMIKR
ncbi:hypothetical protein C5167_038979 [Papaver somniferum]|uniref:Folylpolyglutamate synthase n=1 Tax=Papaver somniferum TaxID=3469 RepID=A0A4Y7IAT9_PAPSO|nr:hypothetical protein C5167_038979 [Papaver somniferum]